jgi:hypothetical protein
MKPEPRGFLSPMRKTTLYVAEVRLLAPSQWHSSHNVDALNTVILCCTNTLIKDSFVQNCQYIFCFWTSKLYVGIKTHDSEVVLGTS